MPEELQQLLLNVFKNAFADRLEADIHPLLQEVKTHLYNRDFLTAFGRQDYLDAYAARWSPSRALGYLQVMTESKEQILPTVHDVNKSDNLATRIVCLGGGAGAEIVALGGFISTLAQPKPTGEQQQTRFEVVAIDIANWSAIVGKLLQNLTSPPPLSKHASATAKAANTALVNSEQLQVKFHQHDILHVDFSDLMPLLQGAHVITIMFTLNELYATSLSLTQKLLLNLTSYLEDGALLLVVDSPGSYSTVSLNGTEKNYPMQWLLDYTLLRQDHRDEAPAWTKVTEDGSKWFRLSHSLAYPIELENMRYQLHLYKRRRLSTG
ncbi:uncharacterized protein BDR25DRAFT_304878 [Lindgomyces ingoldianus]|uniref:Uncharacterized protein n=1 Tax=Lindgomyces ingoldianus TaxID=673940 RepID=A0ACB6QQ26_9PLEO|nr:uncharacterized protein BDR25DRAFT_304878 [Lindgomyces ingoldianus]KAF2468990.1 hypothetical protein BDR25DRAFT_304878 [Lindgomyces ingoldianus]